MNDWDDDWDQAPAPEAEAGKPVDDATVVSADRPDVTHARVLLETRQAEAVTADKALTAARDTAGDREGAVHVAAAKAEAYDGDSAKPEWERIEAHQALATAERALERAEAEVEEAVRTFAIAQARVRGSEAHLRKVAASPAPAQEPDEPQLCYAHVDEWVRKYLVRVYRRSVTGDTGGERIWAAEWWRSAEAISRLEALWRAWEHLRLDPALGMSMWWRDHADHHMSVLMHPRGPFESLGADASCIVRDGGPLPYTAPPPHLFEPVTQEHAVAPVPPVTEKVDGPEPPRFRQKSVRQGPPSLG